MCNLVSGSLASQTTTDARSLRMEVATKEELVSLFRMERIIVDSPNCAQCRHEMIDEIGFKSGEIVLPGLTEVQQKGLHRFYQTDHNSYNLSISNRHSHTQAFVGLHHPKSFATRQSQGPRSFTDVL